MSWLIATLLEWLGSGVLDRVLAHLERRAASEAAQARTAAGVDIARIRAATAARLAARDVLLAEQGHWLTRLPRPMFALPLAVWWAAVIADSLFRFPWDVAALPAPLDEWAALIVAALFLVEGGERVARTLARR